jgi:hypothetical protein
MSSQFARDVFGCLTRTQDREEKSERVVVNLNRGGMAIGDSLLLESFQKLQIFSKIKPGLGHSLSDYVFFVQRKLYAKS